MVDPKDFCGKACEEIGWIALGNLEKGDLSKLKWYMKGRGTTTPAFYECGNTELHTLSVCRECATKLGYLW